MSERSRNPFRLRASEKIESEANFLRLYCPLAVDTLLDKAEKESLWDKVLFIRSAPGAGKTSLLRLFEPSALQSLYSRRSQEYSELYNILKKLNVFNDSGTCLLGVLLTCTRNYEILDDLNIDELNKRRLFFSLLNSRIILSTLRGMCHIRNISFPDGLKKVNYTYSNERHFFKNITVPCSGYDLYLWALSLEKEIYKKLDSLLPLTETLIEGHDELFSFEVLRPNYFSFDNSPVCEKILFMFDDAHKLSAYQRSIFIKYIVEKRDFSNVWISERKEVLEPLEILGSIESRDYEVINIEKFWQDKPSRFERILESIANKRATASSEDVNTFQENLEDDWNEDSIDATLKLANELYKNRINKIVSIYGRFDNWLRFLENFKGSPFQRCILYKKAEILINRNIRKPQLSLEFELSEEELTTKLDSTLDDAAKFYVSRETNLPYYFGFSNLVKLSNNNIEQFLSFSASLFEEILSNNLAGNNILLTAEKQEKIIKNIVEKKWIDLPRIIPSSSSVISFLDQLAKYVLKETYKPNAPIIQGVTGFSITNSSSGTLFGIDNWLSNKSYIPLINVLSICLAYNLLESREVTQGVKGQKHMVFYLNRWLCMKFNLPLAYGGWKSKRADELLKWIKQ